MTIGMIALALIGAGAFLWLYGRMRDRPRTTTTRKLDTLPDLEDELAEGGDIWPHVYCQPAILVAGMGLVATLGMNANFAAILGYSMVIAGFVWALLSVFDLAVPLVRISEDKNPRGKDDNLSTPFLTVTIVSVMASIVVGITSFNAIGTRATNVDNAHAGKIVALKRDIKSYGRQISDLEQSVGGGSYIKFAKIADEKEAAAGREAKRGRRGGVCGRKCEGLKSEAIVARANASDARSRDDLRDKKQVAQDKMSTLAGKQTSVNGFARLVKDAASAIGVSEIDEGKVLGYVLVFIVTSFMIATPFLWHIGVDSAQADRRTAYKRSRRAVYWAAKDITNGTKWLHQTLDRDEILELENAELRMTDPEELKRQMAETERGRKELIALIEANEGREPVVNILPDFANPADKAAAIDAIKKLPTQVPFPISAAHALYQQSAGAWMTDTQFAQLLPMAIADMPDAALDRGMITVSA